MKKIPHFAGKNSLSLTDLQALADAVPPPAAPAHSAAPYRGRTQYGLAQFNTATAEDECSGSVANLPDSPGMIASVAYTPLPAPRIEEGNMQLPLAHDWDPADDSSLPPEQATGGICSINVPEGLKRAQIKRGDILLPLAHSDWGEAEGAMATPGLVYAVQMDAGEDDECSGTVSGVPYIDQGVIHLPAGGGGCSCRPASYTEQYGSCIGLIRSVKYVSNLQAPDICDGNIRLPKCTTYGECPGVVGGIAAVHFDASAAGPSVQEGIITLPMGLQGLQTVNGPRTWADLACAGVVRLHEGDATSYGVSAQVVAGYLNIYVDRI